MSTLTRLADRLFGRHRGARGGSPIAGAWRVADISVPHPFGRYTMELRADGSLEWSAVVPTNDAGELQVTGSGTWRTSGERLHYTSGEHAGTLQYSLEGDDLILDGLPASKIGPGARCVLKKAGPT